MKELRLKKLSLDNATRFRAFYISCFKTGEKALMREFKSLKSMNQWVDRNDTACDFLLLARYAMIDNKWEWFDTVGNKNITLTELDYIVADAKKTIQHYNFDERLRNEKPQKNENEETSK